MINEQKSIVQRNAGDGKPDSWQLPGGHEELGDI